MLSSIKRRAFLNALKSHPQFSAQGSKFNGINPGKYICIVANRKLEKNVSLVKDFVKRLESKGKKIDLIWFYDEKMENSLYGYSRSDIKWNHVPSNEYIESRFTENYDLVIALVPELEDHMRFVLTLLNGKLKVGQAYEGEKDSLFDILIERVEDMATIIKSVEFSLEIISKNRMK